MMTSPQSQRVYLRTLGCPKNRVDTEVMLGTMLGKGYQLAERPEDASVIIVNTCAFLNSAIEESLDTILEFAEMKKTGSCDTLVVAGCLPQRHGGELAKSLPEVDHFVGTGAFAQLADLLAVGKAPRQIIPDPEFILDARTPRVNSMPSYTAYLKVSEGCDNKCAFCIIPKLRGAQRSRPIADLVVEAHNLAASGVVELNLVAQDLTAYGMDLPGRPKLQHLLAELVRVDVRWLRLHYAYPRVLDDAFLDLMATEDKIAKYLDMPIQHASDKLLRSMRRGRDSAFIVGLIDRLRRRVPELSLRTSLIVGLPGETDEDFRMLLEFVKRVRFERLGVFRYSDEEGTAAFTMEGKVPRRDIERRWREVMALQHRISREKNKRLIGRRMEVLVEGPNPESEHLLVGRHQGQAPEIDGQVIINDGLAQPGEMALVEVTEAHAYDLIGRVVAPVPQAQC